MESLWNQSDADQCQNDLELRAYTSRLLGQNSDLVLHGGGNTSVKIVEKNIFGDEEKVLYVKGSGFDLKTIPPQGFSPCLNERLVRLASLETLSDTDMVKEVKASMVDPSFPNPSVEAILHALIPYRFVDHTHADAVVSLCNTPHGEEFIKDFFGPRVLVLPYIMPGFVLAKQVWKATQKIDWKKIDGIILLSHGVFTFSDSAQESYQRMIDIVTKAENYLKEERAWGQIQEKASEKATPLMMANLRKEIYLRSQKKFLLKLDRRPQAVGYTTLNNLEKMSQQGPLTPDHVIHTKRIPMLMDQNVEEALGLYVENYQNYFQKNKEAGHDQLDPIPRYVLWKGRGIISLGPNMKRVQVVEDIAQHTLKGIQWAEHLGGWKSLPEKDIFDVEYWELEQAKLKKGGQSPELEGQVFLVTGAASGIGFQCAQALEKLGAQVIALDLNPRVKELFSFGRVCDVTKSNEIKMVLEEGVLHFGGLDGLVSNAGTFPKSSRIEEMNDELWNKTIEMNLSSHMKVVRESLPYLKCGINPSIVFIGSKNVPAPGKGASAYSCSKAALAQFARVCALEFSDQGIRVNTVHPNAVFDTGIWTDEVLKTRAASYGVSVEDYKKNNLLHTEIGGSDVAKVVCRLLANDFSKTTGAQIPIDGGNERVI